MESNKVKKVAVENQFIGGRSPSIMVLRKLLGAVCRMCYHEFSIYPSYYTPTQVKKIVTGNGKATKEQVAKLIRNNYKDIGKYSDKQGKNKTSDIYDAIGIALALKKGY